MRDLECEAQPQGEGPAEDLAGRSHRGYVSTCLSPAPAAGSPYSAASPVHSLGSITGPLGRETESGGALIPRTIAASAKAPCQTEGVPCKLSLTKALLREDFSTILVLILISHLLPIMSTPRRDKDQDQKPPSRIAGEVGL